ncbi:MAG: sulfite oxidase [Chloroflexi bacterium]|nr:sulfite oxidase [Chloroflexota bacterium]MDE2701554.1 sulfite oxidase [Chloroflexota bacterium]
MKPENEFQIAVSESPFCAETDPAGQGDWTTPNERFFIRSHFGEPELAEDHQIAVGGAVERPGSVSITELAEMEKVEQTVTLECAGNSRSYLIPPGIGLQFQHGAVGNAVWAGIPLARLLEPAGIAPDAVEVLFRGADSGIEAGEHMYFERSLPLAQALDPHTIVATSMDGQPLTRAHGYPARLIVPGWYGMASVKWLTEIEVLTEPFGGHFQTDAYTFIDSGSRDGPNRPVTRMAVKSVITSPLQDERLSGTVTISGFAWSGHGAIAEVQVSTDDGATWEKANLADSGNPRAWRRWELPWQPSGSGHYVLCVRARDEAGNIQPNSAGWNYRGYVNNAVHALSVIVD